MLPSLRLLGADPQRLSPRGGLTSPCPKPAHSPARERRWRPLPRRRCRQRLLAILSGIGHGSVVSRRRFLRCWRPRERSPPRFLGWIPPHLPSPQATPTCLGLGLRLPQAQQVLPE